jgi:hypothetical protein
VRIISEQELKDILDKHGKWLRNEEGGERANLSSANLSSANLSSADLSSANLRFADLSSADLRSADLRSAVGFKFTPLQVVNTKYFITIFDDHVVWGCRKMTFEELNKFELKDCTSQWDESEFKLNKKIITEMIRYYRK